MPFHTDGQMRDGEDRELSEEQGEVDYSSHPYSSQVLHRMAEDAKILVDEYKAMLPHVEHSAVRKTLEQTISTWEKHLDNLDSCHKKYHPKLTPPQRKLTKKQ